jgi:hypothetical protein
MKKKAAKLTLNKETLMRIAAQRSATVVDPVNQSCVQSCYLQSCGGGCGISTAVAVG